MFRKSDRQIKEMRILVSGCLPPPIGGMASFYEGLLASSLPTRVHLDFVQTSSQNRMFQKSGRLSFFNIISSVADCLRFFRTVIASQPHIAHIGTAFGLSFVKHGFCVLIARLCGVKVLLHPHCSLTALYTEKSVWWRWYFLKIISLTHGVVALSQEWLRLAVIMPNTSIYILPNAINLKDYCEVALEHLSSNAPLIVPHVLYLGYLGKAKGSFDLVDAAQKAVQRGILCEFRLIGGELSPGELTSLSKKIKAAGLGKHICIEEPVTGLKKIAAFRWADIFVYPSYNEGLPMAVIEAMACGLPIIASKVGGLPDLITEGLNGLLIDDGCPDQIAKSIERLITNPALRVTMGRRGYERAVQGFDIEDRIQQLISIYISVLK